MSDNEADNDLLLDLNSEQLEQLRTLSGNAPDPGRWLGDLDKRYRSGEQLRDDETAYVLRTWLPKSRPAIDIVDGQYDVHHQKWTQLNETVVKDRLAPAIRSTGKIQYELESDSVLAGSAFALSPTLIATNRHVVEPFTDGWGMINVRLKNSAAVWFNTADEGQNPDDHRYPVQRVRLIHPVLDFALLEIERPLEFELPAPAYPAPNDVRRKPIVVIGYPTRRSDPPIPADVRENVFRNKFDVKRLLPGNASKSRATEVRVPVSQDTKVIYPGSHDASTEGGCSGGCVVLVETGEVIGIHTGPLRYQRFNVYESFHNLLRDNRIRSIDGMFNNSDQAPDDQNIYEEYWQAADRVPA